ncbi:hypothetical protein [Phycicoccus sp. Root101]|uniref:hypothetical protein n=1 Tax=Phycicoccus sp. Root101 TaxID=1736421 RepID=UPI00070270FE|nr:hypothetical protein [Phycicoccus sp. Root101]KQU69467.1 hypothetical protein ASC58_06200 [Phycicoccus sp. Root101]
MSTVHDGDPPKGSNRDRWLPLVLLALVPFVLLRLGLHPVGDPDTFWHLRAGDHLWGTWQFSGPDPFSRFSTRTWVLHEWLPELALAAAAAVGGLPGVAWLACALIALLFVTVYAVCRTWVPVLPAAILATAAVFGSAASLTPRSQLATFLLLPVVVWAWLRTAQDLRARWWLVPLSWVWACSHGLWVAGLATGAAVTAGLLLDRRVSVRGAARLVAVVVLSFAAGAVTPVGPELLLAPFRVGESTSLISEWNPPSLTSPPVAVTLALVAAVVVLWARRTRPVPWTHVLLFATAVGWTLLYSRTVALGALTAAPLLATLWPVLREDVQPSRRAELVSLGAAVVASLTLAGLVLPSVAAQPLQPHGLDQQLDRLPRGTVVYDEYSVGGWLLWRHPQLAPVIDPRVEVFDLAYVQRHVATLAAGPGWDTAVADSGATYALVPDAAPLSAALLRSGEWTALGTDAGYVLLARNG